MRLLLLRYLLRIDAAVLFLLGLLLILAPSQVERTFQFPEAQPATSYIIGLWGCALVAMSLGCLIAATDPVRHRVWSQVGILRGGLECALGLIYLARGILTLRQSGFGIAIAGLVALGYLVLYPPAAMPAERPHRDVAQP